jgi:hypothetical protein
MRPKKFILKWWMKDKGLGFGAGLVR